MLRYSQLFKGWSLGLAKFHFEKPYPPDFAAKILNWLDALPRNAVNFHNPTSISSAIAGEVKTTPAFAILLGILWRTVPACRIAPVGPNCWDSIAVDSETNLRFATTLIQHIIDDGWAHLTAWEAARFFNVDESVLAKLFQYPGHRRNYEEQDSFPIWKISDISENFVFGRELADSLGVRHDKIGQFLRQLPLKPAPRTNPEDNVFLRSDVSALLHQLGSAEQHLVAEEHLPLVL